MVHYPGFTLLDLAGPEAVLGLHGQVHLVAASRGRLKRGSVYVTLGRMEDKGYVTSHLDERPGEGPARRLYEPTALGLRALVARQLVHGDLPLGAKVR